MKVTYRERRFLDRFRCIDTERSFNAISKWKPEGTSLWYFKLDRFNVKTVAEEDLIKVEE